jgi:hypothetical protein
VQGTGASSSGNSINLRARSDTALSPATLLRHYTAELVKGGWTPLGSPAATPGSAVQSFSARDSAGDEWRGALIVVSGVAGREVSISMSKPEEW